MQELGPRAHSRELLSEQLTLDGFILVLLLLRGVFEIDLLNELLDQVFVEVGAEFLRQLMKEIN